MASAHNAPAQPHHRALPGSALRALLSPGGLPERLIRAAALAILLLSFLQTVADLAPAEASHRELLDDLRSGRTSTLQYAASNGGFYALWWDGFLSHKQETYQFPDGFLHSDGDFENQVRTTLGPGRSSVRFIAYSDDEGPGLLTALIPIAYPLSISIP